MADGGGPPARGAGARRARGRRAPVEFDARVRIDTPREAEYFRHGGILQYVLRSLLRRDDPAAAQQHARKVKRARRRPARLLRELLAARGPSGYESAPAAVWRDAAGAFARSAPTWSARRWRSWRPRTATSGAARRLLVMGHIDEIGLIVTHIDDEGYLWFREVGGWDAQILVGQRVVLDTREGPGHGRGRQEADPPAARRGAQEGRRRSATCTSTSARATARRRASSCASATSP